MTKSIFKDKFSINSIQINKTNTTFTNAYDMASFLENKITSHPVATFISIFDNYEHTSNIKGEIQDGIKNALVVIFCFGKAIPSSKIMSIRPRSFGITEYEDCFSIDFMDAPSDEMTQIMITWAKELKNK